MWRSRQFSWSGLCQWLFVFQVLFAGMVIRIWFGAMKSKVAAAGEGSVKDVRAVVCVRSMVRYTCIWTLYHLQWNVVVAEREKKGMVNNARLEGALCMYSISNGRGRGGR